ncbi:MAG: exodeoxyribonuclease VII large subunit, partial [Proteobacteria bacterium]|nr:exodeoxyribonuclease VII large subunit [Pseudomonadota bacterium]
IRLKRQKLDYWAVRLKHPQANIDLQQSKLKQVKQRLHSAMQSTLQKHKLQLSQQMRTLSAVSPLSILERGYSIATVEKTGQVLKHSDDAELGQQINVRLQHGQLVCDIKEIKHD